MLSHTLFDYSNLLRPNEIQLVNRRIGKTPADSSQLPDSVLDLRKFFMRSSEEMNESQLNYLLVKKWVGHEYKKKKRQNSVLHVYLSVDFYYSVYMEKIDKTGKIEQTLKAVFTAESTKVTVREIEKVAEITYIEKGILWDSKKKISIQFAADVLEEFKLHHQQARIMFTDEVAKFESKPPQRIHQSSIPLQEEYSNSGKRKGNFAMEATLTNSVKVEQDAEFWKQKYRSSKEMEEEEEDYYGEGLDEIERNYTSEKFIHIDKFNDLLHHKKEINEELMKELQSEMHLFKKKVSRVEEIEEDRLEDLSRSSNNSSL